MKVKIKKWNMADFFRYLSLTLNKDYSQEFSNSFTGYLLGKLKSSFKREKDYKFAILVNNKFAGSVALYSTKKGYEIGYFILREFRNKGLTTRVSNWILDFGFNNLKLKKIIATTDLDNKTSQKILRKLGFKLKKKDKKNKELLWEKKK